jgi:ABC-type sugar transport system permease subunit
MAKKYSDKNKWGYLFIAPFFIGFLVFQLYPMLYSLYISFTSWDGLSPDIQFIGIENYKRLVQDPMFLKSIANTWIIWIFNIIPQMIFAIVLAVILSNKKIKGRNLLRAIYYLPNLVTAASIGVLFAFLFDWQTGSVNFMLMKLHIIKEPINWMIEPNYARGIVSVTQWWMWFGYSMIIFIAGMKTIPDELYEAAVVDGASTWQSFWQITLPLLRPTILFSVITSLIGGMQIFDIPNSISNGSGQPDNSLITMVFYLYNTAFQNNNYGYGAAIGYGLFVIILIFAVISFKLINRKIEVD